MVSVHVHVISSDDDEVPYASFRLEGLRELPDVGATLDVSVPSSEWSSAPDLRVTKVSDDAVPEIAAETTWSDGELYQFAVLKGWTRHRWTQEARGGVVEDQDD